MKKENKEVLDYLYDVFEKFESREKEANYAKEYAENIIATLREPLLVLDADLKVTTANAAFYNKFEVSKKDTIGRFVFDLGNHQWNIPKFKKMLLNVLPQKSAIVDFEVEHFFDDIGQKIMILNAKELIQDDKKSKMILLAIEDVTEAKIAQNELKAANQQLEASNQQLLATEQQLKATNQHLEASFTKARKKEEEANYAKEYAENIITTLREPLLVLDADLKVTTANAAFYNKFEVSKKDTIGRFVFDLGNHQWNIPKFKKMLLNVLPQKSAIVDFEVEHFFDDIGQKIMILNAKELIQDDKKSKMILLAIEDVTEAKIAQNELKAANQQLEASNQQLLATEQHLKAVIQQLEASNQQLLATEQHLKAVSSDLKSSLEKATESDRLKSSFLSNMSHEIRTPMNGILGFTGLLKKPQLTGGQMKKYIGIIELSGKRMLSTINDIIDISKIEAGHVDVHLSIVSVVKVLKEQFDFFKNESQQKGIELLYVSPLAESKANIQCDKYKLEGILINLIKNAIKYTEQGTITFGYSLQTNGNNQFLEFYVKDTGIGIPSDRIHAIFKYFEQADIEDTRALAGSGLGLAISKAYVKMLGGKIWVISKENEGSTFYFTIPYKIEKTKKIKPKVQNSQEKSFENTSILVAEDDTASAEFFAEFFSGRIGKILYTKSGEETIEEIKRNPDIDIILMDIKMPDMNGYAATREIRKFNNEVIIIAQTAFGLSGDRKKAIDAGCNDYITKPINQDLLCEKIINNLTKKSN